jgi:hypothetical protein
MPVPGGNSRRILFFIKRKLSKADAISEESAVSAVNAGFTVREVTWLPYFTTGWFSKIGKTKSSKYYVKQI